MIFSLYFYIGYIVILFNFINIVKMARLDCFVCAQNIPTCPSCKSDQFCYIIKRSCYQCSRALCASKKYQKHRIYCSSSKTPKCYCTNSKTCLITLKTRISCPKAECININSNIKYIEDRRP